MNPITCRFLYYVAKSFLTLPDLAQWIAKGNLWLFLVMLVLMMLKQTDDSYLELALREGLPLATHDNALKKALISTDGKSA